MASCKQRVEEVLQECHVYLNGWHREKKVQGNHVPNPTVDL